MLRNACRMRASSPATRVLVFGSMPRMPATKMKSPARVPRLHVPVGLMAPSGASVLTPLGEVDCAAAMPMLKASQAAADTPNLYMRPPPVAARQENRGNPSTPSRLWHAGLQRQRMQRAPHLPAQCVIDHLVLLDPRLAAKRGGDDGCGIVIAVSCQIPDRHLRIRDPALDQPLDLVGLHRHGGLLLNVMAAVRPCNAGAKLRNAPADSPQASRARPGSSTRSRPSRRAAGAERQPRSRPGSPRPPRRHER